MIVAIFFFKMVCICMFLSLTSSATREDAAQDFIGHILKIPDSEKVLNSVVERLERRRQERKARTQYAVDDDCDQPEVLSEYTESLQISQEREMRQLGPQKHYPICHLERKIQMLNTIEYEYRPAYYEEVRCTMTPNDDGHVGNEICSSLGFSCVQWNKTIHLTRRRYSSDCWESRTMIIPAGCECMWPVHRLGDMSLNG